MKKATLLLIAVLAIGILSAAVTVRHDPPISLKTDREIVLDLEVMQGFDEIDQIDLYYREVGSASYVTITLDAQPDPIYAFSVPQLAHPERGLEYYFEVKQTNGSLQTLPSVQPALNPYRVQFDQVETPSDGFVRLSPESGPLAPGEPLSIAISTFALSSEINHETIKVTYDGKDVTDMADIAGVLVVLRIERPKPGLHTYQVLAELNNGKRVVSRRWQTKAIGGTVFEMPLNMVGSIEMNSLMRSYSGDDNAAYTDEADYKFADWNIRLRGRKDWFGFFTRLLLTSRETSSAQSINRYTVGFTTPWVDLTLGDETPNYDSFTMSNKNIRGVHALLHSQDFRLYVNWGENRRALENTDVSAANTTGGDNSFKRNTLGVRTEVGELDAFQWGISFVKNKDDLDSIDEDYYLRVDGARGDTTVVVTPKDNIVVGTDFLIPAIARKLELGFEAAFSLYNNNIYDGVIDEDELTEYLGDEAPFDPESFEDIIIINKNMEPFIPSMANMAYRGFVNFNMGGNFLTASYAAVGSAFNSLSANYLQKDSSIFSLSDNVMLFRNQLLLSFGLNLVSDNLSDQKETTNTNTSFFAQAVARPTDWPTLKFGFSQTAASDDSDPIEDEVTGYVYGLEQTSQTLTAGASYEVQSIVAAPTTFEVNWQMSASADDLNNSFDNTMNTISVAGVSRFRDLPLTTTVRYTTTASDRKIIDGTNYNNPAYNESSDSYNAFLLRTNLRFFDDRLKPFASMQFTTFGGDGDAQSMQLYGLGTSYDILENLEASTSLNLKNYANDDTSDVDYSKTDLRFRMRYTF